MRYNPLLLGPCCKKRESLMAVLKKLTGSLKRSASMKQSIIHYVLSRISQLGNTDVCGVPGDYAIPISDAICEGRHLLWSGMSDVMSFADTTRRRASL